MAGVLKKLRLPEFFQKGPLINDRGEKKPRGFETESWDCKVLYMKKHQFFMLFPMI